MDDRLKKYLDERGATPLDSSVLESYATEMTETVIPQIVDDIEQRELLAAELRVLPSPAFPALRPKKNPS